MHEQYMNQLAVGAIKCYADPSKAVGNSNSWARVETINTLCDTDISTLNI